MSSQFLYRAFDEYHSSGVNSSNGFHAGVRKSEYQDHDCDSVREHFDSNNRSPTPWISTTDNLLRAIKRAQQLSGKHGRAGVSIAVIDVQQCRNFQYYLAEDLAEQFDLEPRPWHDEEYLFRWRIPKKAVVCCLSLDTLERRGLFWMVPELLERGSVERWRELIIENWRDERPDHHLTAVGYKAAKFAFLFGDGEHSEHIGLEAAGWWENKVARVVKSSFYQTLAGENDTPECFDE